MKKSKKLISLAGLCLVLLITIISVLSWTPAKTNASLLKETIELKSHSDAVKINSTAVFNTYINDIYTEAGLEKSDLDPEVFRKAVTGYLNLKQSGMLSSKPVISIADFNQSSCTKRLWIIDLANKKLLFNTHVAHGQGSGNDIATHFSNKAESHQSSLGFYITDQVYYGKHGISLRLNGMDEGINDNALTRSIVVHGAEYVSEDFISKYGRLGRSFGCPAVPVALTPAIIDTIKDKTCLFINGPLPDYSSGFLNQETAADYCASMVSAAVNI